jgi:exodeoxyribonuclease VII large subunit
MIRDVLTAGFPRAVWVSGELQGYDRNKGKAHAFFDLVEKDENSHELKAKAGLVIWANTRPKIEALLRKSENAFELKDDIEVKFLCRVDFYPGFGQVRLIVENIDPVHTLGKIAQDRQKLIAELTKSGVLERNKKLALSPVPLRIGLITSFDSAAYNDFMDEIAKSGYGFEVHIFKAVMQGKNCAPSVCAGLQVFNAMDGLDAVVITRGGGSIAELACFDSKDIALALAASRYPVITGIGHEINTSVTDLAAHTLAKTPTATAQFLVARVRDFVTALDEGHTHLKDAARLALEGNRTCLKDAALDLQTALARLMTARHECHARVSQRIAAAPLRSLADARSGLVRSKDLFNKTIQLRLHACATKIGHHQKLIEMASPRNVLKRGFSITRGGDGKVLRSIKGVQTGQEVCTEFLDGQIKSIVEKKNV